MDTSQGQKLLSKDATRDKIKKRSSPGVRLVFTPGGLGPGKMDEQWGQRKEERTQRHHIPETGMEDSDGAETEVWGPQFCPDEGNSFRASGRACPRLSPTQRQVLGMSLLGRGAERECKSFLLGATTPAHEQG
jgi:hypothetical protein